jgi:transposase
LGAGGVDGVGHAVVLAGLPDDRVGVVLAAVMDGHPDPEGEGGLDRERYRTRNQVERLMNRRKQFRAVATRFDKLACRYQATVAVADIFIWLRARPDRREDRA